MAGHASKPVAPGSIGDGKRRYDEWKDVSDGEPRSNHGFGTLFPEGYKSSFSPKPKICHCPFRTCGQAFAVSPDLGEHFVVKIPFRRNPTRSP
ncbi:hypothetical protein B0H65DRAFT_454601 [Neurospora tetraspora]|uniref:Uncharacterized protein n=1 Tax=Neurospora tetraspora TaxID=94610 RepID=A0AAE0JJ61_9PEZI|nr:hypothetical protein B0H65DRAFT_454601 [Neurospora tetraspora]